MTSIPQRWWPGTLPTERLAWDSAVDARDAARRLGAARGQRGMIGTTPALVAASFSALDHLRVDGRAAQPWAPLSGFVATADGWVRTHANYPHHATALERALGAADRDAPTSALATLTAVEAEERICAAGGIAAAVR